VATRKVASMAILGMRVIAREYPEWNYGLRG